MNLLFLKCLYLPKSSENTLIQGYIIFVSFVSFKYSAESEEYL